MENEVNFILCGEATDPMLNSDDDKAITKDKLEEKQNTDKAEVKQSADKSGMKQSVDKSGMKQSADKSGMEQSADKEEEKQSANKQDEKQSEDKVDKEEKKEKEEKSEKAEDDKISEYGQATLESNHNKHKIHLLSIIGEIEGHETLSQNAKTTKYEHVLPQLAVIEDDEKTDGLLILINTVGGDVSCGLALAEMISSLSIPTVSLVIGDSHSIGVPLAVATDYSFIVPTGTMIIHPVRMSGMVIGAPQTFDYFQIIQDRIASFVSSHSRISKEHFEELMLKTGVLTKDLGSILVGEVAVQEGIINEVGGIKEAVAKLHQMIDQYKEEKSSQS